MEGQQNCTLYIVLIVFVIMLIIMMAMKNYKLVPTPIVDEKKVVINETKNEVFSSQEVDDSSVSIGELNVVFYGYMGCPYCRKTKEMFEQNSCWSDIEFVDTSSPEGHEQFVSAGGGAGVPYFKSNKTGKTFTGFPGTVEHLVNSLSVKEGFQSTHKFAWYGHMGCPWCRKTKEMFETEKINAKFHDTRTPEGKEAAQKIGLSGGVPFIRNLTTNKETRGFPGSYESLLEKTKL